MGGSYILIAKKSLKGNPKRRESSEKRLGRFHDQRKAATGEKDLFSLAFGKGPVEEGGGGSLAAKYENA